MYFQWINIHFAVFSINIPFYSIINYEIILYFFFSINRHFYVLSINIHFAVFSINIHFAVFSINIHFTVIITNFDYYIIIFNILKQIYWDIWAKYLPLKKIIFYRFCTYIMPIHYNKCYILVTIISIFTIFIS